jgi:xanthine dehydrogenase molybdenum-binding subunit
VLKTPVSNISIVNGVIFQTDNPTNKTAIPSLIGNANNGQAVDLTGRGSYVEVGVAFSSGGVVVELEVDPGTGEIIVDNVWGTTHSGFSLNPGMIEIQEIGGQIMGLGYTLSEEYVLDTGTGKVLTMNPIDNRLPTITPTINPPDVAQPGDPNGPYGAIGIGEAGMMGAPAAFINAVYNAIGVRFYEFPMTPDKVLSALGTYNGAYYKAVPPKQAS